MKIVRTRTFFLTLTDFLRKIKRENRKPSAKGADTLQYPENVMIDRYYASWLGINAVYDKFASLYGVTSNVLCLLDFLIAQEKPVTQMEIGRFMRLPKQTIASMVNGLEKKGLAVRQIAQLLDISPNIVFVDSSPDERRFDSVVLNFRLGVEQALDYLLYKGHRKIGFLGPAYKLDQKKRPALEARRQYFIDYMKNAGLYDEHLIIDTGLSAKDGSAQIRKWLEQKDHIPTALLAYNEESAITAVSNLREVGLRIPEDVSVISFNDTPLSILTEPPLTSVTAHLEVMGEMAVKMLLDRLDDPQHLPYKIVLPPTLAVRDSVVDIPGEI